MVEILEKLRFYERYGVEEFYIYDPDRGALSGYVGGNGELITIGAMNGWVSPRLGYVYVRESELVVLYTRYGDSPGRSSRSASAPSGPRSAAARTWDRAWRR
jgi:hypothetical protein